VDRRPLEDLCSLRLRMAIEADISAGRCDGVALRIERDGDRIYEGYHGFAERASGRALGEDSVFVAMSVGKQFINVLALAAVERGALSLWTQAGEILPAFAGSAWRGMTIAHLLTHTSGVLSGVPPVPPEVLMDTARLAAFAAARGPESVPGERVNYSIIAAHAVLAEILRAVDGGGRDIRQILQEELFAPLGMHDTSLGPRADLLTRLCPVVARYDTPGMFDPRALEAFGSLVCAEGCAIAAGGYLTTLHDLSRFVRMLARGGELDGARLLSPAMLALCARNQTSDRPNALFEYTRSQRGWQPWPAQLGLGFFVRGDALSPGPLGALNSAGTLCGWGAGSSAFWTDPHHRLSFSFLSTGLMEDSVHVQRLQRLSDIALSALAC
jgi:CubicO group peptidase (beta-lactamase class C family)